MATERTMARGQTTKLTTDDQEYVAFSQSTQLGVFAYTIQNTVGSSGSKDEWDKLVEQYLEE